MAGEPLRVCLVAPFARDLDKGGSQRATAIAERLEQRGASVRWEVAGRRIGPAAQKLGALARGRPGLVAEHAVSAPLRARRGELLLVAHSYLAPHAERPQAAVVDFHNLEWQHLLDVASRATGPRRPWLALQAALMRRTERALVGRHPLSLFTSEDERAWAGRPERTLVVPNRLPRAAVEAARAIRAARAHRPPGPPRLAYVGTLAFPPNAAALQGFLQTVWPVLRAAQPDLVLDVAGGTAPHAPLPVVDGVVAHGFVPDLAPLLTAATAAVFPFAGRAGSSLRALFLALAGVPVIGSPDAFRGHGAGLGVAAATPPEWAAALERAMSGPPPAGGAEAAEALQADDAPWDRLYERLATLGGDWDS